ncbi:major facilitator superfamily domain-containing protein 3-like isoform X2 [Liolophura sinensis]|uniref:major facilitator superfamily domain-containing protein 3-like isoform X2 n=1 Tax=Liolophura sinensis TaxID=3198878 RepID=UPI003158DE72
METYRNILLLAFLYFIQGLPYGLQARFLPIYLRTRGMSLTNVGLFKLLLVPWMCKAMWAPLVDRVGTKKSWLMWSLVGLVITCALGACLEPNDLVKLGILMLVLNLVTSTQDIAVDGLAIKILSSTELAMGNISQVVGYKLGAIMGGGVFLWLSNYITWSMLFWCLSITYAVAVLLVHFQVKSELIYPREEHKIGPDDNVKATENISEKHSNDPNFVSKVVKHISDIKSTEGTTWITVYVLLYKLVSSTEVGFWTGVAGQGFSVMGSLLGGWLISGSRFSPVQVTLFFCSVRVVLIALQTVIILLWPQALSASRISTASLFVLAIGSMSFLLLISGVVTTATFTMMMQCSQRAPSHVQASHYTTLATLEVMGKLSFSVVTGPATDLLGYGFMFSVFTVLSLLVLILYQFCPSVVRHPALYKNH